MSRNTLVLLTLGFVVASASPAHSQEFLRPVSEYVEQYVSNPGNTEALRYVARRCGATLLLLSNLPGDQTPADVVDDYTRTSTAFVNLAVTVEESAGLGHTEAAAVTERAIQEVGVAVQARLERNVASTGNYLAGDMMIREDVALCTGLAGKLMG